MKQRKNSQLFPSRAKHTICSHTARQSPEDGLQHKALGDGGLVRKSRKMPQVSEVHQKTVGKTSTQPMKHEAVLTKLQH